MSEEEFIKEIKKNPNEFGKVYDEHYRRIFNYCLKRTKDFNTSRDICAETFLKAFLGIGKFKWKGISIQSWLYKIATNEIRLYYRAQNYRPVSLDALGWEGFSNKSSTDPVLQEEQSSAEKEFERHKQFLKVRNAITGLPIIYQEVLTLKYFENLKIKEISGILNKPEGTVKSLLSRGIKQLKQLL